MKKYLLRKLRRIVSPPPSWKKNEQKVNKSRLGKIEINMKGKSLKVDLLSLKEFKDLVKEWKEIEFITFNNGAIKCSEIESIIYYLDEGIEDLGSWDQDDNDKSPKTPPSDDGKKEDK